MSPFSYHYHYLSKRDLLGMQSYGAGEIEQAPEIRIPRYLSSVWESVNVPVF